MEQEPNKEAPRFNCESCGNPYELNDQTATLYLFLHPSHMKYSFLQRTCPQDACKQVYRDFVDIEDVHTLGYLNNVEVFQAVPDKILPQLREYFKHKDQPDTTIPIVGKVALEEAWSYFWKDYDPEPWEFNPRQSY